MPKTSKIEIRCTPEIKAAVQAAADKDGRSLSNWCERALMFAAAQERATKS